jgi:hypothetical protein
MFLLLLLSICIPDIERRPVEQLLSPVKQVFVLHDDCEFFIDDEPATYEEFKTAARTGMRMILITDDRLSTATELVVIKVKLYTKR